MWKLPFLAIALLGTIYTIYKLNTRGIEGKLLYLEQSVAAFQVNDVDRLEWAAPSKTQYFVKLDNKWNPDKTQKIENLIHLLAKFKSQEIPSFGDALLQVKLRVKKQSWKGSWDGKSFMWTEGPIAGVGQVLSSKSNDLLAQGQWFFEDLGINLCRNRITSLEIQDSEDITIEQINNTWTANQKNLKPPFFEKWLISLCDFPVRWMDLAFKTASEKAPVNMLFSYVDGSKINIQNRGGGLFSLEDKGFVSKELEASVLKLQQELDGSAH